jgi:hypothetical protein
MPTTFYSLLFTTSLKMRPVFLFPVKDYWCFEPADPLLSCPAIFKNGINFIGLMEFIGYI